MVGSNAAHTKDQMLLNMLRVTKKKAEIVKHGLNNVGDTVALYLDK